jgi:hypothetical protein
VEKLYFRDKKNENRYDYAQNHLDSRVVGRNGVRQGTGFPHT